jgi:dihydrofolate reductase
LSLSRFAGIEKDTYLGQKETTMRKLVLSMQVSLDGYVEGPNGDMRWMQTDDGEQWDDVFEMLQSVDLMILGRVMFPEYRDYWKHAPTNPKASANEVAYARLAEKTKHIVFSSTMTDPQWSNTQIINGQVAHEIAKIKKQPGKDIYLVGGAKLAATVIEAGLVDEYRLTINPVIIGSGKSFFRDQHSRHVLEPVHTKVQKSGVIMAAYRAKH